MGSRASRPPADRSRAASGRGDVGRTRATVNLGGILLLNLAVVFGLTTALWGVSVAVHDTSIVDVFWGTGFVVIAWVTFAVTDGSADRRLLLAVLTTVWGLRLTLHLARRNLGHGEDPRYQAMRERHGERWPRPLTVGGLLGPGAAYVDRLASGAGRSGLRDAAKT